MKSTDIPKKHPVPFAKSGDKNSIPQSGGAAGAATLTDGFPPETMVPVIAGGIPPDGKDMNGVLFELSDMGRWANAGAEYTFDPGFSAAIGGYPSGAKLLSSDGKGVFISEIDDNTANPEVVSTKWVGFSNYHGAITATTGVHTLTALEASRDLIVVSGTLTGNVQLVFPAWVKHWQIINSTTGNFSITCKTATGSGVVVKGGFLTDIYGDGTSISSHANTDVAGVVRSVNDHGPDANGEVTLPDASTAAKGVVQLSSATNSANETLAATPKAVKAAYDLPGASGLGVGPIAKTDAYSNIAQFFRVNASSKNAPPLTGNIAAGVVSLPCDAAPSTGYLAIDGAGNVWVGRSAAVAGGVIWTRVFTAANPQTAAATGLGNVGNFMSVQQGGVSNQGANKLHIGWGTDGKLRLTVDQSDQGLIFTTNSPPPYPVTSVNGHAGAVSLNDGFSTDNTSMWWDAFSSQLRIQVGTWSIGAPAGASTTVAFPKAFPNLCLFAVPVPDSSLGTAAATEQVGVGGRTNTTVTLAKGLGDSSARGGKYLAIGY